LLLCGACSTVPQAAPLPTPARTILPLPAPIQTQEVHAQLFAGPNNIPATGNVIIVYTPDEHEKLMANIAELYRWVAEAMTQLEFYRRREED